MDQQLEMQIEDLASKVSGRYAKRCRWTDREEVRAAAVLAMVDAARRYDEGFGVERGAFLWRVAVNAGYRAVHKMGSPVSGEHRVSSLRGTRAVELEDPAVATRDELLDGPCDAWVHRVRVAERVRARCEELVGPSAAEFALGVLGGVWTPKEVAAHHGIAAKTVYAATRRLKETLSGDAELFTLWREL